MNLESHQPVGQGVKKPASMQLTWNPSPLQGRCKGARSDEKSILLRDSFCCRKTRRPIDMTFSLFLSTAIEPSTRQLARANRYMFAFLGSKLLVCKHFHTLTQRLFKVLQSTIPGVASISIRFLPFFAGLLWRQIHSWLLLFETQKIFFSIIYHGFYGPSQVVFSPDFFEPSTVLKTTPFAFCDSLWIQVPPKKIQIAPKLYPQRILGSIGIQTVFFFFYLPVGGRVFTFKRVMFSPSPKRSKKVTNLRA